MNLIKRVLKEYKCSIDSKKVSISEDNSPKPGNQAQIESTSMSDPLIWPKDFLPSTKYMDGATEAQLDKLERMKCKQLDMKSKKLVQVLTQIDLDLIQAIKAEDLINYNGHPETKSIQHVYNVGKGLTMMFCLNFEAKKLFKMLKLALLQRNYNLIHILVKSLQNKRLSFKKFAKVAYYKQILEKEEGGIFPLAWMLKDCEDSNLNVESEVASLRFCKIIEKLKDMKTIASISKVTEKQKQMIYSKLWETLREHRLENEASKIPHEYLYLIV